MSIENNQPDAVTQNESTSETQNHVEETPKSFPAEYVKKLRAENEAARKEREALAAEKAELAKWKEERENADLLKEKKFEELAAKEREKSAKLEKEKAELATSYNQKLIRTELKAQAIKAGIIDVDDVKSIDLDELSVDEDGNVDGVEDAITKLQASKPHWFTKDAPSEPKPKKKVAPTAPNSSNNTSEEDWNKMDKETFNNRLSQLLKP